MKTHFDLLRAIDSAKDDLGKSSTFKWPITYPSNHLPAPFDDSHADMVLVQNETSDVFSRHFRKLPLEQILEADEEDGGDWCGIARGNDSQHDLVFRFFHCRISHWQFCL